MKKKKNRKEGIDREGLEGLVEGVKSKSKGKGDERRRVKKCPAVRKRPWLALDYIHCPILEQPPSQREPQSHPHLSGRYLIKHKTRSQEQGDVAERNRAVTRTPRH